MGDQGGEEGGVVDKLAARAFLEFDAMVVEVPPHAVGIQHHAAAVGELVERVAREVARDAAGLQRTVQKQNHGRAGARRVRQHLRVAALGSVAGKGTAVHNHPVHHRQYGSRMMQKKGTLASIAAELGVSRTTVSNAYNRPDQLSDVLRERIFAAAAARGYTGPDPMARSLRTRRVGAIGVILTEHMSFAFEDLASIDFLAGLGESSMGTHNALTLIPLGPDGGESPLVASALVDGFVVYSVPSAETHLDAVRARGVPVVVCDQPYDTSDAFVGIDDRAAIRATAEALVGAGHQRIGIAAKRLFSDESREGAVTAADVAEADMHVQRERILGALDVFAGAEISGAPIVTRHFNDHATTVDAARELFDASPDLTAILCTTDSMALGVLDYCATQGWDVPGDVSVTGFDGVAPALTRGLTTVIQPNKRKGATVGKVLAKLIDAHLDDTAAPSGAASASTDADIPRVILPTRFSPGRTVAPPRE